MKVKRMTSRERVAAAARREPVDRIPLMLWIEGHTTLKIAMKVKPPKKPHNRRIFNAINFFANEIKDERIRTAAPLVSHLLQSDYLLELGADMVDFQYGFPPAWIKKINYSSEKFSFVDMYGIERALGGIYMESVANPCDAPEKLDRYVFPDLSHPIHYEHIRLFRKIHPDASIVVFVPGVQDWSQSFLGMERLYVWLMEHPEAVERFFRKLAQHTLQIIRGAARAGADVLMIGDDYGTQNSLLMSKDMWNRFTFPCLKRQCGEIHRAGKIAMLHSCGSVMPLVDRFVDAGVDMLHPLQAVGKNDLEAAKKEFGARLTFVTGIDVQYLPEMSPEEVRESMLKSVEVGAEGGGMILCTTNFLQEDTPVENLMVMFDTIKEIQERKFYQHV